MASLTSEYQFIQGKLDVLQQWLETNNIGTTTKKRKMIVKDMFWIVSLENNISVADIQNIITYIDHNPYYFEEGSLWESLSKYLQNDNFVRFFKDIFNLTPIGLNTSPNACCGKGELLYRLLRPTSRQPNKGDIIDEGIKKELKGNEVRIYSESITGKEYRQITSDIFDGVITGNIVKSGGLKGTTNFEIEKHTHNSHYIQEFDKLEKPMMINLFKDLLQKLEIDGNSLSLSTEICKNGYDQTTYQKILLKDWFNKDKKKMGFDEFIIMGDGTNIKILKDASDLEKLTIYNDYFRINQNLKIGWYVK